MYMANRKRLIEDILNSFHAMRHKIKSEAVRSGHPGGITHSQWFVLGMIEQGTHTNMKDISNVLGISSSAITQLVDGLVRHGYVTRKSDPQDRRSVRLQLSTKGDKRILAVKKQRLNRMAKLFDVLNDSELKAYLRLHKKIISKPTI